MAHTISFCVFDDLNPAYGPKHVSINDISKNAIEAGVREVLTGFNNSNDPSSYYYKLYLKDDDQEINGITDSLVSKKYYVLNRFEKILCDCLCPGLCAFRDFFQRL